MLLNRDCGNENTLKLETIISRSLDIYLNTPTPSPMTVQLEFLCARHMFVQRPRMWLLCKVATA